MPPSRSIAPLVSLIAAAAMMAGCEPEVDEEAAAPPDTVAREGGSDGAREYCRHLIRERLGLPRERVAIQEDALIQSRGTGRFESDGLVRVLAEDETTEAVHRFDCLVRHTEDEGWGEERLEMRPVQRRGSGGGDAVVGSG